MESIICIPSYWKNEQELPEGIRQSSDGYYVYEGSVLRHSKDAERHFELEFCGRDDRMYDAFRVAGLANGIMPESLSMIERHASVVYIKGAGGSMENAEALAQAAAAVLKAGGMGLKVETAGMAFTLDQWMGLLAIEPQTSLYRMYVIDSIMEQDGTVFSCGMHNLGLRDTIVSGEAFQEAVDLIKTFSYYQIVDKPAILDGETFSGFRISEEANPPYKDEGLFSNPFGVWRLSRIS